MNPLVLVFDDEPDVEVLFHQQFRRDLRTDRFTMEFVQSAPMAFQRITDAAGVSYLILHINIRMRSEEAPYLFNVCCSLPQVRFWAKRKSTGSQNR